MWVSLPTKTSLIPREVGTDAPNRTNRGAELHRNSRIIRNLLALGTGQIFTWISTAAYVALLPRYLGSSDLGSYSIALLSIAFLGPLADLGITTYLTRETARSDRDRVASLVSNALLMRLPLLVAVVLFGFVASQFVVDDSKTRFLIYLVFPSLILQILSSIYVAALKGMQSMGTVAFSDAASKVLNFVLVLALLLNGLDVATVVAAHIVSSAVALVISAAAFYKLVGRPRAVQWQLWRPLMIAGMPFFFDQISIAFHGQIDILILSNMTDSSVVGWYAAAMRLITIPMFIPALLLTVFYPALSELAERDRQGMGQMARQALHLSLLGTLPLCVGLSLLSGNVVSFLGYPADFSNAIPLISILAFQVPIVGVNMMFGITAYAMGMERKWVKIVGTITVVDIILNLIFINPAQAWFDNGAIASAVITVVTEIFVLAIGLRLLPAGIFGSKALSDSLKCVASVAVMALCVTPFRDSFILIPVAVGAVSYATACLVSGAVSMAHVRAGYALIRGGKARHDTDNNAMVDSRMDDHLTLATQVDLKS